ncbi:MAG: GldG family protein [Deltaproteobacteria bacterium]|nr:GldG family protein [Deltaproteobacteria bacterium]
MKVKTAANSLVVSLSAALILVLLNVFSCQAPQKVDLTEYKIYSLTDASKKMVKGLPEKVIVKAYIGNIPPNQADKQQYLENLLTEYAESSGGKLSWEKVDPWNKPELEEEVRKEGIQKLLLLTLNDDKQEQVPAYFAVVFQYLDKKEVWQPDPRHGFQVEGLEFEFSTRIKRLAFGKKKVGVTTGFGEPPQAQALMSPRVGLGDLHDVTMVNWQSNPKEIENVDTLIVNGPVQKVSDAAKYYLDQHLMNGKPVLFLVRGMSWQGSQNPQVPQFMQAAQPLLGTPADHGLSELLAHYGFEIEKNTVLDPNGAPGVLVIGQEVLMARAFFPLTEVLAGDRYQPLEGLKALALPFTSTVKLVGALAEGKADGVEVKPLLRSLPSSFVKDDVMAITREFRLDAPTGAQAPKVVGYYALGKFKSFFADKPKPEGVAAAPEPPKPEGQKAENMSNTPPGETIKESPVGTRLVVIGGSEFAEDKMFQVMQAMPLANVFLGGFQAVHTMVDWLAQDMDLVGARAKQVARPIQPVEKAEKRLIKLANIGGIPLALFTFGMIYWRLREARRRNIQL